MIKGPLLQLLGPLEAHARSLWAPRSPTVALRGPPGPLGVLESSVTPSIPLEALQPSALCPQPVQGSLDLGIWEPARALWAPSETLLNLSGPLEALI